MRLKRASFLIAMASVSMAAAPVLAENIVGSPSGTITLDGSQMPPRPLPFGGKIADGALQSTPWWPPRVVPPSDAPNVLLIITDDLGFGVPSTFGGVIPTETMDALAAEGSALHRHPFDRALLAHARGASHGAQPPLGGLRRDLGTVDRLSRL